MSVVTTMETEEFTTPTLYPHPILKATTIPYDFNNRSQQPKMKRSLDLPTKRAIARVLATFLVAFLIFVLLLFTVQCFKLLVSGFMPFSHHGNGVGGRSANVGPQPIIGKPTTGYIPWPSSSNYRSRSPTYTIVQRPIVTADR